MDGVAHRGHANRRSIWSQSEFKAAQQHSKRHYRLKERKLVPYTARENPSCQVSQPYTSTSHAAVMPDFTAEPKPHLKMCSYEGHCRRVRATD